MWIFWMLFGAALLMILQSIVFARWGLQKIQYSRHFNVRTAFVGDKIEMVEVITNRKSLPLPWLRVESYISPYLRFNQTQDYNIAENQFHQSVFFLWAFRRITRRHAVTCLHRGTFNVNTVALTTGDLFGMGHKSIDMDVGAHILVYPRLLQPQEMDLPTKRWQGDLIVRRWIVDDPFLISGIREYQPQDSQRDIHWGATARTGALQVKVRDHTADPRLIVLLNIEPDEMLWGELNPTQQEKMEDALSFAATICIGALRQGVEAGFGCNATMKGTETMPIMLPVRSQTQSEAMLDMMANIVWIRQRTFQTFLENLETVLSNMDIIILSYYDSEAIQNRITELRARGNNVALHHLGNGGSQ